jgi:hypothetical protein
MGSPPPPDVQQLLADLTRALRDRHVGFMLIGGQAVLLHGAPRLTDDIDLTLGLGPDRLDVIEGVARALALEPLVADAATFVRETFVDPARHPESGFRLDFIFSNTPYEQQAIARAVIVVMAGERVPFASAEDPAAAADSCLNHRQAREAVGLRQAAILADWEESKARSGLREDCAQWSHRSLS